ncbi:MAG: hypothetical protein V4664_01715 [Patescibacteria group bacterium]
MIYLIILYTLITITALWVIPVAVIANVKSFRVGMPQALRFIQATDGAWYWSALWTIAMAAIIMTILGALPFGFMMFPATSLGHWVIHFVGDVFDPNAKVILYNFIELDRKMANFYFGTMFFAAILGLKGGLLGVILSWRLWHGEDVSGGN